MTVRECKTRMTSFEFMQWSAFTRVEPIGEERQDFRVAFSLAAIAAMLSRRKVKPDTFLLNWWKDPMETSEEGMKEQLISFAKRVNAIFEGKK